MKKYFIVLFALSIIFAFQLFYLKDKRVIVKLELENGQTKTQEFTIPEYANLNIYKNKNGEKVLQWQDNTGYYHTIYYGIESFEIIY